MGAKDENLQNVETQGWEWERYKCLALICSARGVGFEWRQAAHERGDGVAWGQG